MYKTELIHRRAPWNTKESMELVTLEWVSWFNHHRLLVPLRYIPPAKAESNYYRQFTQREKPRFHFNQTASTKTGAIQYLDPNHVGSRGFLEPGFLIRFVGTAIFLFS